MKKPSLEEFDLVVEAIRFEYKNKPITLDSPIVLNMAPSFASQKDREGTFILLDTTQHSELKNISQDNIRRIINRLEHSEKVLRNKSPYTVIPSEKPMTFPATIPKDPLRFLLKISSSFDNWYSTYLIKKSSKLENLSLFNLEKICNLVIDIDEKFQINPEQTITINIDSLNYDRFPLVRNKIIGNTKIRLDFRKDALDFLEDRNLVYQYDVNRSSEIIEIALNVEEFPKFKEEIIKIYEEKSAKVTPQQPKEPSLAIDKKALEENKEILYEITFSFNNEILLNNIILSKVNFDSENHKVFEYLLNNPNRRITKKEFKEKAECSVGKSLHKIVENLGFTGNLRKLFFSVSEQTILFKNPVTREDLEKLKISSLKLKRNGLE